MIEIKHLRKAFGERVLFDDLSIVFPDGALVGLFGPSGCGKTTFLNLVSLLEPLDAGELVYAGKPYADLKKKALEKYRIEHFSYIFPEASLLPALNVYENVLFPSRLQGLPLDEGKARGLLRELGLEEFLEADVSLLSSGEKQRVAIARALLSPHPILIADEPTSHLDPERAKAVIRLLKERAKQENRIFLCSCHDQSLFGEFDLAYTMEGGKWIPYEK